MKTNQISEAEKAALFTRVKSVIAVLCEELYGIDALNVPWEKPIQEFLEEEEFILLRINLHNVMSSEMYFEFEEAMLNLNGEKFRDLNELYEEFSIVSLMRIQSPSNS